MALVRGFALFSWISGNFTGSVDFVLNSLLRKSFPVFPFFSPPLGFSLNINKKSLRQLLLSRQFSRKKIIYVLSFCLSKTFYKWRFFGIFSSFRPRWKAPSLSGKIFVFCFHEGKGFLPWRVFMFSHSFLLLVAFFTRFPSFFNVISVFTRFPIFWSTEKTADFQQLLLKPTNATANSGAHKSWGVWAFCDPWLLKRQFMRIGVQIC